MWKLTSEAVQVSGHLLRTLFDSMMYTTMYYNIEFFVFQPCFINDLMPIKLFVFTCILQDKCSCPCEPIQCLCLKKSLLCHDYVQWCGVNCAEEESVEHDVQRNLKFKYGYNQTWMSFLAHLFAYVLLSYVGLGGCYCICHLCTLPHMDM